VARLTTLYSFCSQSDCRDGANPLAGLIQAANGELFGTTRLGGSSNFGTIFKINPSGVLTTLFSFDFRDGEYPHAGLVQAANGDLYGTTHNGGANNLGTVFRITLGAISSSCVWRWVQTYGPELDKRCRPYLKPTNQSWRVDETYIKVKGQERFLYRAVDSSGQTIDFLLTAKRDTAPEPPKESRLIATTRTGCCSHCLNCRRARHSHRKSP
jgi:uncharacterized repeat protein (TIGR03803 family)